MPPADFSRTLGFLHERVTTRPRVGLILGSGLGPLADALEDSVVIPFADIPGFAPVTVSGHGGALVAGRLEGVECIALQGRFHLYEGHPAAVVTLPVRAIAALGAEFLVVTNAAGGIRPDFRAGDLMLIHDHINLMARNPLIGPVVPGEQRLPDLASPYDAELRALAREVSLQHRIRFRTGVYASVSGPSYETPAEIRVLRRFGADAVGMSTVPEVLVARALGLRVCGLSLISNPAAGVGVSPIPLAHSDVLAAAASAAHDLETLMRGLLLRIGLLPGSIPAPYA